MISRTRMLSVAAAGVLALVVGVSTAHAQSVTKCVQESAKASRLFVKKTLRDSERCFDRNLRIGPPCDLVGDLDPKLDKQETKLRNKIGVKCGGFSALALSTLGFPGKCIDPNPADQFTAQDLEDCMFEEHTTLVDRLLDLQYGALQVPGSGPLDTKLFKCQREIARQGFKFVNKVLTSVQKCRNKILQNKLGGIVPRNCSTSEPKTALKVTKAASKAEKRILARCDDALNHLPQLDVCDTGGGPASTAQEAADCIIATHQDIVDNPAVAGAADMIDFEYAEPRSCGDGVLNQLDEECDGDDDAACPGDCGDPLGSFACLCTDPPGPAGAPWLARERAIEHAEADLDNGWTGRSHDSGIVEGGGYVSNLYDCDGPGGPDVVCTTGPSCALLPNQPCVSNANCLGAGNFCRKDRTATGPHCHLNVQIPCTSDTQCTGGVDPFGVADFCKRQFHGPPLPLSAGGISVCVLNIFSEDVVGTTNVAVGSSSVRLRQRSVTHLGPTIDQPCPVCGGFCNAPGGGTPGNRTLCSDDSDCPASSFCVTEPLCSYGPNVNQECRPDPPNGGPTAIFGNPSKDCLPAAGSNISGSGLDILFNPATTGTVSHQPVVTCDIAPFNQNVCVGGVNDQKKCPGGAGDCPGGTCGPQCYCPTGGGVQQKPNDCASACVGGINDGQSCGTGCVGGFCHDGDCRLNAGDTDSAQEGQCTLGPADGACSDTIIKGCAQDDDCQTPTCQFCEAPSVCIGGANDGLACQSRCSITAGPCTTNDDCPGGPSDKCNAVSPDCPGGTCGEQCIFANRQCFVNGGPFRQGVTGIADPAPGVEDRITAAAFCIAGTTSAAINATAGLPGPGMITQPVTVVSTGF